MSISLSFHKVQAYWKNHTNISRLRRERTLVRYASFLSFAAFNKNILLSADATTIALLVFRYFDESVIWGGGKGGVPRSLVLCVCVVDRGLIFYPLSFGHCVVCSSSIK
jgi:hypothetical protein